MTSLADTREKLIFDLANRRISREAFLRSYGSGETGENISLSLLEKGALDHDAVKVELGIVVGSVFGFSDSHKRILSKISTAEWHHSHEDIVSALGKLEDPGLEGLFVKMTEFVPSNLRWDQNRALARKALYELARLRTVTAHEKITNIARSRDQVLSRTAHELLKAWTHNQTP